MEGTQRTDGWTNKHKHDFNTQVYLNIVCVFLSKYTPYRREEKKTSNRYSVFSRTVCSVSLEPHLVVSNREIKLHVEHMKNIEVVFSLNRLLRGHATIIVLLPLVSYTSFSITVRQNWTDRFWYYIVITSDRLVFPFATADGTFRVCVVWFLIDFFSFFISFFHFIHIWFLN